MTTGNSGSYPTRDVVEILGISRRQLQYWSQTNLVTPSAKTPGGHRRYSFEDLVALKAAKRLIAAGVSVQRIRTSIQSLRNMLPEIERPLSELVLVATGDIVLVFHGGTAFEAVSGQEWVFEVAEFQREVEAWSREVTTPSRRKTRSRKPQPEQESEQHPKQQPKQHAEQHSEEQPKAQHPEPTPEEGKVTPPSSERRARV